jgi:hypothetical protein
MQDWPASNLAAAYCLCRFFLQKLVACCRAARFPTLIPYLTGVRVNNIMIEFTISFVPSRLILQRKMKRNKLGKNTVSN